MRIAVFVFAFLLALAPATAEVARAQIADSVAAADAGAEATHVTHPVPRILAGLDAPIHPLVTPSPMGRQLAAVQVRPRPVLWILPVDGGDPFSFREMWAVYHARWSPAGQRIGFLAAIGPPRVWTIEVEAESGRPIDPPRMLIRTAANAFAFAPDGERLALVASRSTARGASEVHIVDWATRRYRVLLREDGVIYRIDWAADGAHLYYGLLPDDAGAVAGIVRASLRDGSRALVRPTEEYLGLSPDGARLLYRPPGAEGEPPGAEGEPPGRGLVEIAPVEEGPVLRLALPDDAGTPTWSADSRGLLVVRVRPGAHEVWEVPIGAP